MSFQENKFPILLGVVTALVTGGLVFWSVKSGGAYQAAKDDHDESAGRIDRLMRGPLAPTEDNLIAKKQAVEAYAASVEQLQEAFDPLRRPKLENIEPSAYTDELLAARRRVIDEFEKVGAEVPDAFFLGHGRFSDTLPQRKDTGVLGFQLAAFEEMLTKLARARPTRLANLHWGGIPSVPEGAAVVPHSLEVTFTGPESSLREFLSALDDSEKHIFAVRVLRVRNERETAPNANDARFEAAASTAPAGGGAADPFGGGGFIFPDEDPVDEEPGDGDGDGTPADDEVAPAPEPEPEPPADGGEILKQVLGTEDVHVFLRIDVLQFLEPRQLP